MKIAVLGGLRVEHGGASIAVAGAMQLALLFRLAADAGTAVSYRALAEDLWPIDTPENPRGALQSIVSRLRTQLPTGTIESTAGGYRLVVARADVDALVFQDLVAAASAAPDPAETARLATQALALWAGEPWLPSPDFDWFSRDLLADRTTALELGGRVPGRVPSGSGAPGESGAANGAGSGASDGESGLDARRSDPAPTPLPAIPTPLTPLIGRDAELATVADQLAANRLVTIFGPGGAGKTRLALEAAQVAQSAQVAQAAQTAHVAQEAHPAETPQRAPAAPAARSPHPALPAVVVELAPVAASELWGAILAATGRELRTSENTPDPTPTRERALQALAGRPLLLVLDNCEHLIDAAAEAAVAALSALPELRILATSREPLGAPGEAFVTLGPLAHPDAAGLDGELAGDVDALRSFAAVELFRQRARAARGVELDAGELVVAARICLRLDGLPLALELAAAKLRTMTPDEVLAGLEDRFALLAGPGRGALPRHQTLRAMIDWSWSLLDPVERQALTALAVFPAGVAVADARAAAAAMGLPSGSAPAVFDALVDRSLVQRARGRFRTLETIREYGIARLSAADLDEGAVAEEAAVAVHGNRSAESSSRIPPRHASPPVSVHTDADAEGDPDAVRAPHADALRAARDAQALFAAHAAGEHDPLLRGPRILEAIAWFDAEHDNLLAGLRHLVATGQAAPAVRLATGCVWYWMMRDRNVEAAEWIGAVSPLAAGMPGDLEALFAAAGPVMRVFQKLGPSDEAHVVAALREALGPAAALRPHAGQPALVQVLASAVLMLGELDLETDDWRVDLRAPDGERLGLDPWPTAVLHLVAASIAHNRGDVADLGRSTERALALLAEIGDLWCLAIAQQLRAEWLALVGRLDEALELTDASTDNLRRITSQVDLAQQQDLAVRILIRRGDLTAARTRADDMLAETRAGGVQRAITMATMTGLVVAVQQGDVDAADALAAGLAAVDSAETLAPFAQLAAVRDAALAHLALLRGDVDRADTLARDALGAALDSRDLPVVATVAVAVARVCLARGDAELAARVLLAADAARGVSDELDPWVRAVRESLRERGIPSAPAVAGAGDASGTDADVAGAGAGARGAGADAGAGATGAARRELERLGDLLR
ncbi:ATPase [Schumannella sp. 10F1B-5-1]|uniref:AfsR/SARP family transcriptional regulator n=1 Tax=Schumannella sp. 10F1B-5-1 TaxID=2590780 RepID=UPI0011314765|nr:ATPase [Schumannella sp. 10F1B-5-1]TPW78446.1 ATPase [Schumannella sp. 10F1B-5-1]